eukprot:TRINITY_DN9247_c0_g1_i1.p1 TRINITY_DN9247_c0_g1~~TRINITY_DN9247_c0_g1_i1.p1  ORF type:complete len:226 (+),score=47.12 TRINITY_DN9247_c0_g1_i1:103-780(+)
MAATCVAEVLDLFLRRSISHFRVLRDGSVLPSGWPSAGYNKNVVLSGSFNPLHDGHIQLLQHASAHVHASQKSEQCGTAGDAEPFVGFEMSVMNADKPTMSREEIERRIRQFEGRADLVVTAAPKFADKADILPTTIFVVGYDTAVRIVHPKYYRDSEEEMERVLLGIGARNCSFAVAGRTDPATKEYCASDRFSTIPSLRHLFFPLPHFRNDISSTELRARQQA